ncbi:MAG TPA: phosphate starvation-inducible protein PhoH, partial [Xanthomonadaceae bacterium]|nr:phosphate starvation-inducible protein PhoH [Xanthomonadaceae bacterium]
ISFQFFGAKAVVRHPLVAKIVRASARRDADAAASGP